MLIIRLFNVLFPFYSSSKIENANIGNHHCPFFYLLKINQQKLLITCYFVVV